MTPKGNAISEHLCERTIDAVSCERISERSEEIA